MISTKFLDIFSNVIIWAIIFIAGYLFKKNGGQSIYPISSCVALVFSALLFKYIVNNIKKHFEEDKQFEIRIIKRVEEIKSMSKEYNNAVSEIRVYAHALEAENKQLKARIAELENATSSVVQEHPYTLWREVLAMRKEGMTDKQIAAKLYDKGQGASKSQLGALLYTGKEKLPAAKTLQDNGTELFR